jgi:hypothetical protein
VFDSAGLLAVGAAAMIACTFATASWDTSESRANSFPEADEAALEQVHGSLHIQAHLAPEDPRRSDLEHRALSKLRRVMPKLQVQYESATSIGLFEQNSQHYGEIWYELDGRKVVSRVTTAEGVLEAIYQLAGLTVPVEHAAEFRGHSLRSRPRVRRPLSTVAGARRGRRFLRIQETRRGHCGWYRHDVRLPLFARPTSSRSQQETVAGRRP